MNPAAGFWRRYAAYSLDATAISLVSLLLLWPRVAELCARAVDGANALLDGAWPLLASYSPDGNLQPAHLLALARDPGVQGPALALAREVLALSLPIALVVMAVAAAWFIGSEASRWQASPGKRLLGLRVTHARGQRCGAGRIALRFVAGAPSWLLLHLGHAMAGVTPSKRTLHDVLSGTRVELAPGASPTLPRGARSWLLLQAAAFFGLVGFVVLRYVQLLVVMATGL